MKFQLVVNAPPDSPTAREALSFTRAFVPSKHQLLQVFFYGLGVLNVLPDKNKQACSAAAEWRELANTLNTEIICCINSVEAHSDPVDDSVVQIAGMAQLIVGEAEADRTISFGVRNGSAL